MKTFLASNIRHRHGLLAGALAGLVAAGCITAVTAVAIPNNAPPASAAVAVAPKVEAPDATIPAVIVTAVGAMAGWDSSSIEYAAPMIYTMYDDISTVPGVPAPGPDRPLNALQVRVTIPASLVTADRPVLGASSIDSAPKWVYLGTQVVGPDRVFDYAYQGPLEAATTGPSQLVFGFPMTFKRNGDVSGSGSVGFVVTSTSEFTYMPNAGLPGGPADRCSFSSGPVICRTDLRIF